MGGAPVAVNQLEYHPWVPEIHRETVRWCHRSSQMYSQRPTGLLWVLGMASRSRPMVRWARFDHLRL